MSKDRNISNSPNPTQQPSGYIPCPIQADDSFDQNKMSSQLPPVLPRPDFVKDDRKVEIQWGDFTDLENKGIRRVFIRKVYSILMIQLTITFGLIALFHFMYVLCFFF
ncbi:unnamed protein product [Rotaria sp. Silwood1]|nr:unnamed protein product [Rotaria sp. Silwood1]